MTGRDGNTCPRTPDLLPKRKACQAKPWRKTRGPHVNRFRRRPLVGCLAHLSCLPPPTIRIHLKKLAFLLPFACMHERRPRRHHPTGTRGTAASAMERDPPFARGARRPNSHPTVRRIRQSAGWQVPDTLIRRSGIRPRPRQAKAILPRGPLVHHPGDGRMVATSRFPCLHNPFTRMRIARVQHAYGPAE